MSVGQLPGVGAVTEARLQARGFRTATDLLALLPRGYDDLRQVTPPADLARVPDGTLVVVQAQVERVHLFPRRLLDVVLSDGVRARWFRPPRGMNKSFVRGSVVAVAGPLHHAPDGTSSIVQPRVVTTDVVDGRSRLGIRVRYPKIEGVPGRTLEKIVAAALERVLPTLQDPIPAESRAASDLPSLVESLRALHDPAPDLDASGLTLLRDGRSAAHRRLAFDALFVTQLALALERARGRTRPALSVSGDVRELLSRLKATWPFAPTEAQVRAIHEIAADLEQTHPMQRLLQGDVGSGKTAVVFAAAALAARAGGQTFLMAPTEILADQHLRTMTVWGQSLGLRVARLAGATPAAERRQLLASVAQGTIDLLIGTHALLAEDVVARKLVLTVVDEQHRFGVRQRAHLRRLRTATGSENAPADRGDVLPHMLVLSATPIPRTLALALYGDLDVTLLDELPAGRRPVVTEVATDDPGWTAAHDAVRAAVTAGEQAFVVCPAVHARGSKGPASAVARFRELRRSLAPARVGLLHGQLTSADQGRATDAFRGGELDVLVATSLLDVGVDVPRATVMVVEDADRFGLAQLHQLRGRVGRGSRPGRCWLCTRRDEAEAKARLAFLASTTDGFKIAEEDLRRRGPGDLFGGRQSGASGLGGFAWIDLVGPDGLLEQARREARALLARDPDLAAHPLLAAAADARWVGLPLHAEEAG